MSLFCSPVLPDDTKGHYHFGETLAVLAIYCPPFLSCLVMIFNPVGHPSSRSQLGIHIASLSSVPAGHLCPCCLPHRGYIMQNNILECRMSRPINQPGKSALPGKGRGLSGTFSSHGRKTGRKSSWRRLSASHAKWKHPSSLEDGVSFFSNCQPPAQNQVHPLQLSWNKGVDCHSVLFLPTSVGFLTVKQVSDTQKLDVFTTASFLATCSRHTILKFTNEYICFAKRSSSPEWVWEQVANDATLKGSCWRRQVQKG